MGTNRIRKQVEGRGMTDEVSTESIFFQTVTCHSLLYHQINWVYQNKQYKNTRKQVGKQIPGNNTSRSIILWSFVSVLQIYLYTFVTGCDTKNIYYCRL
jgi:hypothetical protein